MSSSKRIKLELNDIIVSEPRGGMNYENNKSLNSYVNSAIEYGEIEEVKSIASLSVDINEPGYDGWTPLHMAIKYGYDELVEFLIKNGANVDSTLARPRGRRFSPLHIAVQKNQLKCAKVLLKHGASVSPKTEDVCHPIHIAVSVGHVEMVGLLLEHGADVNLRFDNFIFTVFKERMHSSSWLDHDLPLLHCSILRKFDGMTDLLLGHGADVNLKTSLGKTTLMQAVEVNDIQLVEFLIEQSANVNDRDNSGQPVLHFTMINANRKVSMYSREEFSYDHEKWKIVKLLVEHGVDVNARFPADKDHSSVIHYMIKYGFSQGVYWLLFHSDLNFNEIDQKSLKSCKLEHRKMTADDMSDSDYVSDLKSNFREIMANLMRYAIGRKAIKLPIDESVVSDFPINDWVTAKEYKDKIIKYYKNVVLRKISFMKMTKIGDSNITIWHLLTCKMNELAKLMSNNNVREFHESLEDYKYKIFDYFHMMKQRLGFAEKRRELVDQSTEILFSSFSGHLPFDCCQYITNFVQDEELEAVVHS